MESEKTKVVDLFPATTTSLSELSDPAIARRHHEVTDFPTMSKVSEKEVAEEKEEVLSSQDTALLFVVEEQVWSRFCNPLEREASVGPESSQGDPEASTELSERGSNLHAQETSLQDPSLDFYQGGCTAAYSSRGPQSFLSGTTPLEQDPTPPSKGDVEQLQDYAIPVGFPQAPNFCDTFLQPQYEETLRVDSFPTKEESVCRFPLVNHGIAKCHQDAESSKSRPNEEQSWEPEAQKELAQKMKAMEGSDDELPSKSDRDDGAQPIFPSGNEEKGIEIMGQMNDIKSYASPKCSELSNGSRIDFDATQAMPDITSSPSPSKTVNSHSDKGENVEDLEKKSFISGILHLSEDKENTGRDHLHSPPKDGIQTKHVESNTDCSEFGSTQKELGKLEPVKMEVLEMEDLNEEEEDNLNWKEMENAMETEQERLEVEQGDQEHEREVQNMSREVLQKEKPVQPGLEILYTLENDSVPPEFNKNHSWVESEGLIFPLVELFSPDVCPESACVLPELHVQTTKTNTVLVIQSPKTQPTDGQWEYSGGYEHTDDGQGSEQSPEGGSNKDKENAGDVESMRALGGEGMALLVTDSAVTPDPHDVTNSQLVDHPVDDESHILASPPGTKSMTDAVQGDAGKGANDSTIDYAMVEEEPGSIQESLGAAVCRKASVLNSDFRDIQTHHKKTTSSLDFCEETDGSVPKSLQMTRPAEALSTVDTESIEQNLVSSLIPQDPESPQAQDASEYYLEKFQQHLKPPIRCFVFPGKEAEGETLNTVQETILDEPPCFVVLDEGRTECEDSMEIPTAPIDIATHLAESPNPLSPVPIPDQTQALETVSRKFSQSSPPIQDCRQPAWCVTPPPNSNAHAQPPDPELDPKHPTQTPELLPSSNQTGQFFTSQPTSVELPAFSAPTKTSVLPLGSALGPTQPSQLPEEVFSFDCSPPMEYDTRHPTSMPAPLPQISFSMCTTLSASLSFQPFITDSSQMREATTPELTTNALLPQLPLFDFAMDLHHLPPASTSSLPPTTDNNQSAPQSAESRLALNCLAGDAQTYKSLPNANLVSQDSLSVLEAESHVHTLNSHRRTDEPTLVHLAKMEGDGALQAQEKTSSDLTTNSDSTIFGNDPSALYSSCTSEATAKMMDQREDKSSSDYSSQPSIGSQEMPEIVEGRTPVQIPPMLAFTNPIHFLQLGPPSPPTIRHPQRQHTIFQGPQQQQVANAKINMVDSAIMQKMAEGTGKFWKGLEKSEAEPIPPTLPRKEREAKHLPLEKSTSCPNRSIIRSNTKDPEHNSKAQEGLTKIRPKSKDWHRVGVRKVSIPTENTLAEATVSLAPSKVEAPPHKHPPDHLDRVLLGEKKYAETVENIKRRPSKLIHSSQLLYQEYSDVALNKAIQKQKRADSLPEELELVSPGSRFSPKLRRKVPYPQDSCLQRLSVSSSASLWQDIPMVRGSTMLLSMTHEEQKLQEAKFELIASEASYLRSLNVAVDHFQRSPELQAVLTNQDKQWLFSRLHDVRDVSANFLFDLEEKLEENMFTFNVCDVALKHAPEFRRVYLPYVTNQTYQEQTFRRLMNGVPAFQQVLEKLESDPICQRLSLKSFLILPFQRITRLKLLLQNILKKTRPGADEEIQATQAYDALEKLIKDCNENVQRMKNTEELIYLSKNMEFECKIFPLVSQSRRLVKRGELTALEYNLSLKWKLTTRPIYLHLFNDFLLLSRPRENGHFIVFDYAASSEVRGEKCEMKLHGANKNVFRLFLLQNNQGKKVEFLFRTETQSEKLRWISALSPQQAELDLLDDPDAPQVQCVKSYKARENDELALEKADIIMVLRQSTDGWTEGMKLSDGERGWFPSEQVELISSKQARQMNLKEQQRVKNAKQQVFRRR